LDQFASHLLPQTRRIQYSPKAPACVDVAELRGWGLGARGWVDFGSNTQCPSFVEHNPIVCHSEPVRFAQGKLREESRHFFALTELSNAEILRGVYPERAERDPSPATAGSG
jgi:hypothetical protein